MGRDLLDVVGAKALGRQHLLDGDQREIGEVLVVDGVELHLLHQPQQVRELEGERALRLQHVTEAAHEVADVRNVGQHVGPVHQVGPHPARRQRPARGFVEEDHLGRNPLGDRHLGGVGRRLDPKHRHARLLEILQEVAVVRGDLDHQRLGPEAEPADRRLGVGAAMLKPAGRIGREVGVVGVENRVGRHRIVDLHQEAAVADARVQRIEPLRAGLELRLGQVGVRRRLFAQVDQGVGQGTAAEAAGGRRAHRG